VRKSNRKVQVKSIEKVKVKVKAKAKAKAKAKGEKRKECLEKDNYIYN
jgi:hypothetical protein